MRRVERSLTSPGQYMWERSKSSCTFWWNLVRRVRRRAFHFAETVQMGLVPFYVYERASFVLRGMERDSTMGLVTVYVYEEVMTDSRVVVEI